MQGNLRRINVMIAPILVIRSLMPSYAFSLRYLYMPDNFSQSIHVRAGTRDTVLKRKSPKQITEVKEIN